MTTADPWAVLRALRALPRVAATAGDDDISGADAVDALAAIRVLLDGALEHAPPAPDDGADDGGPAEVRCPKCGTTPATGRIRYVEAIESWRAVVACDGTTARIESDYQTGEGYDDGANPRFECHGPHGGPWCGHQWALPAALELEFT